MANELKKQQRLTAYRARAEQANKDALSRIICSRFMSLPAYRAARTVMWYLHCRTEVRTTDTVRGILGGTADIVVPYCTRDEAGQPMLGLWRLSDLAELQPGTWGILEPPTSRWGETARAAAPEHLDLIMVPGVAFDKTGGRLGNGAGYYDRLLRKVRPDCVKAGVCFEAQLMPEITMAAHDVYMDFVITENAVYPAQR